MCLYPPIKKQRPLNAQDTAVLRKHINDWLGRGLIRKASGDLAPFMATTHVVPNTDGGGRVVMDTTAVNKCTMTYNDAMESVTFLIDSIPGFAVCSCLDIKSAYLHITVAPECRHLTRFTTPWHETFEMVRFLFGLKNAVKHFTTVMRRVCADLPFVKFYLDDVFIFSTSYHEHMRHLELFFNRMEEFNRVKVDSCCIFNKSLTKTFSFGHQTTKTNT